VSAAPTTATEVQEGVAKVQALIANATDFRGAILAEGAAEAIRRIALAMDIPKALVADSAELLIWAQGKVGEMLGETSPGKRHDKEPSPPGESLDRMARHRYRDMARIGAGELRAYLVGARERYLADDVRISVFSPRVEQPGDPRRPPCRPEPAVAVRARFGVPVPPTADDHGHDAYSFSAQAWTYVRKQERSLGEARSQHRTSWR
jgi:hypothetical protein